MKLRAILAVALCLAAGQATAAPRAGILRGVNVSGAELGGDKRPGREGTDYTYPDALTLHYFAAAGMTVIRLPVLWERLQPRLGGELSRAELALLDKTIMSASAQGLRTIIDVHNYGVWRGAKIGSPEVNAASLADLWRRIATHAASLPGSNGIIFGIMNEPHDIDARRWAATQQAAINAIRATGARNLLLISGTGWDGAHNFVSGAGYGTANAVALADVNDPAGNMMVDMHQYLDPDASGTHADCIPPSQAADVLNDATQWLRRTHKRGFLGEFGAARSPGCLAALDALLTAVDRNADVWSGWTYWAAGAWWGDYMFSVQPTPSATGMQDATQMVILRHHLVHGT